MRNFIRFLFLDIHIAEAGPNPITQLGLHWQMASIYVEYYLVGMNINDFG